MAINIPLGVSILHKIYPTSIFCAWFCSCNASDQHIFPCKSMPKWSFLFLLGQENAIFLSWGLILSFRFRHKASMSQGAFLSFFGCHCLLNWNTTCLIRFLLPALGHSPCTYRISLSKPFNYVSILLLSRIWAAGLVLLFLQGLFSRVRALRQQLRLKREITACARIWKAVLDFNKRLPTACSNEMCTDLFSILKYCFLV